MPILSEWIDPSGMANIHFFEGATFVSVIGLIFILTFIPNRNCQIQACNWNIFMFFNPKNLREMHPETFKEKNYKTKISKIVIF